MINLTESLEDYLENIYIINLEKDEVRITDVAKYMSISKPSVNRAVRTLKSQDLICHEKYGKIILTEKGKMLAEKIYLRHRILTDFFIKVLNVDPVTAEKDACKIEHILSQESMEKVAELCP